MEGAGITGFWVVVELDWDVEGLFRKESRGKNSGHFLMIEGQLAIVPDQGWYV